MNPTDARTRDEMAGMPENPPAKILIVDDERYIRDILSRWLEAEGYHCVTAANADAALKLLKANNISLILLDIMMPEQPGTVILHRVRERNPDVAFLVVSALDRRGMAADTFALGADGYITKPFDRDEIAHHVASALQRREEIRAQGERSEKETGEHRLSSPSP